MTDRSRSSCLFPAILALLVLALTGCDYLGYYTRHATWQAMFENQPRMKVLQRYAPQDSVLLNGRIIRKGKRKGPLLLAAVSSQYRDNEIVAFTTIRDPLDEYTLFLPKGDYGLFVFADINKNGIFERNELVGQASKLLEASTSSDGIVEGPPITLDDTDPGKTVFRVRVKVEANNYIYSSLDDEFFDPDFGRSGLYNPAELMAHTQGFLFGLENYDERKTTVLFVHGIGATPRDWKYFVDGMDRTRFQPFFLYYPSGMPLDKIGALLAQLVESLDRNSSRSPSIVLVAHSMGGLVALSAINKLSDEGLPGSLRMYCSFSTPYLGDEAAKKGVATAPVVVPVWRDIAADSDFLQKLHAQRFPPSLPFYLFFTYRDPSTVKLSETSDGVVPLRSQLPPSLQSAAAKVYGFNESHEGLLTSSEARKVFLRLLDRVSPPIRQAGNEQ